MLEIDDPEAESFLLPTGNVVGETEAHLALRNAAAFIDNYLFDHCNEIDLKTRIVMARLRDVLCAMARHSSRFRSSR